MHDFTPVLPRVGRFFLAVFLTAFAAVAVPAVGQDDEWTQRVVDGPGERRNHAMAYDAGRGVTVSFGGWTGENILVADTWEWDGTSWTQRMVSGPSARSDHTMVYDASRGVMVMFGGLLEDGSYSDELWEWDGTSWTQRVASGPSARRRHAMGFDAARGVVVLFGGYSWIDGYDPDTWEWDGASWTRRVVPGPFGRSALAMAYDAAREVTVMFGGYFGGAIDETWEWDGTDWTQRLVSGPSGRVFHTMAYDEARGVTVLFGGTPDDGISVADTWEWDGASWVERNVSGPSARTAHAMAYDSARGVSLVFGGSLNNGQTSAETWEWGVLCPPQIDRQPQDQRVVEGDPLALQAFAAGNALSYQWFHNDLPLSDDGRIGGTTTNRLTIATMMSEDTGAYTLTASSGCGSVKSDPAVVTLKAFAPVITPARAQVPVEINLTSATDGASIYYTLDDSDPSPENGELYTIPVTVDAAGNLRAAAFADGFDPSDISVGSYWASQVVHVDPPDIPLNTGVPVGFDLDASGNTDASITSGGNYMMFEGAAVGTDGWSVAPLPDGLVIGPNSEFNTPESYFVDPSDGGHWPFGSTGFVGVRFWGSDGALHYGWMRVRMPLDSGPGMVFDWAYEAEPNLPILAGDTGVPTCRVDLNDDGEVNTLDFLAFLNAWTAGDPLADWNDDGTINTLDFLAYLNDWAVGC